jgi:acyl-CoA reductase-like NAD-dependent aldehyde dehydrogenase
MEAFFASKWAESPSGVIRAIRNPWNQEIIDSVPEFDAESVDWAMQRVRAGIDSLATMTSEEMGESFTRATEAMKEAAEELATLITEEQGKSIHESRDEVAVAINLMDSFGKDAFRLGRQLLPLATEARVGDRIGYTRRRPYGISALLTPNTFPFLIPTMLVVPALAAGNAVVLKPASGTPFSALRLVRILVDAGMPEDSLACLTGPGTLTGQAICRHPLVNQITCYGGSETIQSIRAACGLVPMQFHHGGMGVCMVAADGDLDLAADQIVSQAFENAGQTAISTSSVFAEESVYDDLLDRIVERTKQLKAGDPKDETTDIGPITEAFRILRADKLIADLVATGARCLTGTGARDGNLIEPTLISEIDPQSPRFYPETGSREILAPIVGVSKVAGELNQISEWLDPHTQLSVSIFSKDIEATTQLASSLPVFNVHVNGIPTWRDGLIFDPGSSIRLGRRSSRSRVSDLSTHQDVVFHGEKTSEEG